MPGKKLRHALENRTDFIVFTELTGGPGYNLGPIESFLAQAQSSKRQDVPPGFDFVGIALPQSPGGVANLEPTDVIAKLTEEKLLDGLDVIPHITCKDHNLNALKSALVGFRTHGIESVLALTGDKPIGASGVFELESIGLLDLMQQMNRQGILRAKPEEWDTTHQFLAGAAVSPFKYTEASQMQQYYKMEKKVSRGADFLITQLGWDWRKSQELMFYLRDGSINIPVIGNVYLLTTKTPAPRLMHTGKLPGCFVSDALYRQLQAESFEDHLERAAQQIAMYRDLGAAGVDIGGIHDYETLISILSRAEAIGRNWAQYKENLSWPRAEGFYLYDEQGKRVDLRTPRRTLRQSGFHFVHDHFFTPDRPGTRMARGMVRLLRADQEDSAGHRTLTAMEKSMKYLAFRCEDCGDCYLPENFGYCTMGRCEKGLSNAPCGDSTADGKCGNNSKTRCTGELIYDAAAAEGDGRERLRTQVHQPRDISLANSPSWVNFLCGRDHTARNPLQIIGEAVNAEHPSTHTALQWLARPETDTGLRASGALRYLKALIQSQADAGADYVALRLDALNCEGQSSLDWIVSCVERVRQWGRGVPVCIDSTSHRVVEAGLQAWSGRDAPLRPPLIRWTQGEPLAPVMSLRKKFDFRLGILLAPEQAGTERPSHAWIERYHRQAQQIFDQATQAYGFKPDEILFECPVTALSTDLPEDADTPSLTHIAFETLGRIKQDRQLKGVRCALDVQPAATHLPRAIGVYRAYVAKAMEYGMDTCWADAQRQYGRIPADENIVAMVDAFAKMDGDHEARQRAGELLDRFCQAGKKPGPKPPLRTPHDKIPIASKAPAAPARILQPVDPR